MSNPGAIPVLTNEYESISTLEKLKTCVESSLRSEKENLIGRLPENTPDFFKTHIKEASALNKKYTGRELEPDEFEGVIAGKLFEMLTYAEYEKGVLNPTINSPEKMEEVETLLFISNTLCKIAVDPQSYGLKIMRGGRIPDGVYTGISKKGDFYIYGLSEAKMPKIDTRALDQIRLSGSRATMAAIVENANSIISEISTKISSGAETEELERDFHLELIELAMRVDGRQLRVNRDNQGKLKMSLELLVPNKTGDTFDTSLEVKDRAIETELRSIFDSGTVKVKTSPFFRSEIHNMAKVILEELAADYL